MDKNLIFEDKQGRILRYFAWDGLPTQVVHRGDTKRLELMSNTEILERKKIPFHRLAQLDSVGLLAQPYAVGDMGHLKLVQELSPVVKDAPPSEDEGRLWWYSLALMLFSFSVGWGVLQFIPQSTPKLEAELKQEVIKIVKKLAMPPPPQIAKIIPRSSVPTEVKTVPSKVSPSKVSSLKRMGALSALGSLSSGKKVGGLDIGAAQSSAGPGLGGGTQGSGGVQTSIYAKGMVGAPLGAGNNLQGAGGYGTKGKGGGQAGYGKLALTGSSGASLVPLGAEASVASGLDRDQIAAVINRNLGQVRFCYEQGLQSEASLHGRVAVHFVIGGNGLVQRANVESSTLNSKSVEDCIVMRLKTWKFPVPEGGVNVEVTYPFNLRRSGQG